jgi:putative transposase
VARPYYAEVEDGTFHVTSRGIAKRTIFKDERDCRSFLLELKHVITRHRWRCLSYCLMVNHFHLIVQTPKPNLAAGMRDLKSNYARTFNGRRGKDGSRFKAGYKPQLIQDNAYLLAAGIYVAQNPVRAGMVTYPDEWPWSSYSEIVRGGPGFIDASPILRLLDADPDKARHLFAQLALGRSLAFDGKLPIVGDAAFISRHAPAERPGREVVKRAWEQARPTLVELSANHKEDAFIREARLVHRYTLVEIAAHLGCNERTVRRRLQMSGAETRLL